MMNRLAITALLLTAASCSPEGTWSRHGASTDAHVYMAPSPQAIAKSINWWVTREYGAPPATVDIAMIDALQPAADTVLALVPNARLVSMDDPAAIRVEAMRLGRNTASVDLNAPRAGLPRQLITVDMRRHNGPPWTVTGANWWRFNEQQIREVHEQLQASDEADDAAVVEQPASDDTDAVADGDS